MALSVKHLNFASGELAPALWARSDNVRYSGGLKVCRNFQTLRTGGVSNRPGTYFVCELGDSTRKGRLIRFQFNASQTYALLFEHLKMRVIKGDSLVLNTAKTITAVNNASPVVVTSTAHGFTANQQVFITGVVGETQLNGRYFRVGNVTANTFALFKMLDGTAVNGAAYGVYVSGGTVASVFELTTPYIEGDIPTVCRAQSADVITLVHPTYPPAELRRTGDNAWALADIAFVPPIVGPANISATSSSAHTQNVNRYKVVSVKAGTFEKSLPGTGVSNNISAITKATEGVMTIPSPVSSPNGQLLISGDEVTFSGITGMTELNGKTVSITRLTSTTFKLNATDTTGFTTYTGPSGVAVRTHGNELTSSTVPTQDTPITITWDPVPGASEYHIYKSFNGVYGFYGVSRETTFSDTGNVLPNLLDTVPEKNNPFDGAGNYPTTAAYFQQRLIFANTNNKPEHIFASVSGDFHNFSYRLPQQADDSFTFPVAGREVNEVNHLLGLRVLVPLTTGGEWVIQGDTSGVITFASHAPQQEGFYGSSEIAPLVLGNNAIFLQANNRVVIDLRNDVFALQGYRGTDITLFSSHLFEAYGVVDWCFQQSPDSIVWSAREDGALIGLTYLREQEVIGWHRHDTEDGAGFFENVVTIGAVDHDALYAIVRRTVNGISKRYVEKFADRTVIDFNEDAHFVDCGVFVEANNPNPSQEMAILTVFNPYVLSTTSPYFAPTDVGAIFVLTFGTVKIRFTVTVYNSNQDVSGTADVDATAYSAVGTAIWSRSSQTVTGLEHLEGKTVAVLNDGNVEDQKVVSGGSITLDNPGVQVHVGLPYNSDLQTLDIENPQGETLTDKKKNVARVTLMVHKSRGGFVGPDFDDDHMYELQARTDEGWGEPIVELTDTIGVNIQSDWSQHGSVCIRQKDPLPLTVLAIVPYMSIGATQR